MSARYGLLLCLIMILFLIPAATGYPYYSGASPFSDPNSIIIHPIWKDELSDQDNRLVNITESDAQLISSAAIKKAEANGIEIAYMEFGSGEPLLMITGFSATMDMWSPELISKLSNDYHVIIFDNRGTGYSTYDERNYTIPLLADDTKALLDSLGIGKAHIFGWSMGTTIAQELTLNHPERVISLSLYAADCGGKEMIPPDPGVYDSLGNTSGTEAERGMRLLKLLFPGEWFKLHPDISSYFPTVTETISPDVVMMQYSAMEKWNGSYRYLHEIDKPVLLITGTEDVLTPPENSLIIAEKVKGSGLIQLKDSGHGAMYQYPEKMASAVKFFLSNLRPNNLSPNRS